MTCSLSAARFLTVPMLVVAALLLLPACGKDSAATVRVDKSNAGQTIEMKSGGTLVVSLPSNPTTGYAWKVSDPTGGLTSVGDATYTPSTASTPLVGAGGTEVFTFKAGASGLYNLGFSYVRSFEPNGAPADTYKIVVNVK